MYLLREGNGQVLRAYLPARDRRGCRALQVWSCRVLGDGRIGTGRATGLECGHQYAVSPCGFEQPRV